jgi:hypothetical protein
MSNYVQITSFGPKDALSAGDPNKKIVGSQFDAEFAAIATAVASKKETVTQGDVTAHQAALTIAETQITDGAVLARVGSNETITGTWTFSNLPSVTGATIWTSANDGIGSGLDADLLDGYHAAVYFDRTNHTGTQSVSSITGLATSATVDATNATNISSGTLALARLDSKVVRHGGSYSSATITVSTSSPTGGSDGDIWLKV